MYLREVTRYGIFGTFFVLSVFALGAITRPAIHESEPIGTVQMWPSPVIPASFLLCDGASLVRSQYPDLYACTGTTYGSVDGTHFNLPDFRGVFPRGAGTTNRALGKDGAGNFFTGVLGTYYQDSFQGHYHINFDPGHTHPSGAGEGFLENVGAGGSGSAVGGTTVSITMASGTRAASIQVQGAAVDATHGAIREGFTTSPPAAGINFIIKYKYYQTQYLRE